jgi:RNA polymerase sigma-70 factor (ECF subfamily)
MFDEEPSVEEQQSTLGLLERMRAGDRAAGDALFRQHRARLLRALRARLAPETRYLVEREELVQETFKRALSSIDRFHWRGQGAFLAWLLQIATHTLQDLARRAAAGPVAPVDARTATLVDLAGDSATPSAAAARSEELEMLERALDRLPEGERDALVRRKILGQDYPSLAQDLGLSEAAARMRVSRAMVELSRWAQSHAYDGGAA